MQKAHNIISQQNSRPLTTPAGSVGIELLAGHLHEGSSYCLVCRVGDWLIIATVSGTGRIAYDGADLITEPDDRVLIRRGALHGYSVESSLKRWDLLRAHFQPHPHWLPWLDWSAVSLGLFKIAIGDNKTMGRFREVYRLFTGDLRRSEALAMNALEALLLECDDLHRAQPRPESDAR